MTPSELAALCRGIAPVLRDAMDAAVRPFLERLAAVEAREPVPGPAGPEGKPGAPGTNGKDGVGFDDLTVEHDGARGFTFKWTKGDRVVEKSFTLPVVLDQGVYSSGSSYVPGDAVSYGGSLWIAQEPTGAQPGTSKAWRLAVKHGRDGRNGKDGERGPEGKQGAPGRDLTQIGPGGQKWG